MIFILFIIFFKKYFIIHSPFCNMYLKKCSVCFTSKRTNKLHREWFSPYKRKEIFHIIRGVHFWFDRIAHMLVSGTWSNLSSKVILFWSKFWLFFSEFKWCQFRILVDASILQNDRSLSMVIQICRIWISIFADAQRKTCCESTIVAQKKLTIWVRYSG